MDEFPTRLDKVTIAPCSMQFQTLRGINAGRASDRIPIVCLLDHGDEPGQLRGYRHVDFMSVYVVREGTGVHLVDDEPFQVQPGDVYAMGFGMSHRFERPNGLVLDTVHFQPEAFSKETLEAFAAAEGISPLFLGNTRRWLNLPPPAHYQVVELMQEMREEWSLSSPDRALMVQALFMRLLVFLGRRYFQATQTPITVGQSAKELIDQRYAEPLKISDLAALSFLSIGRFTEIFREEIGCSPREYLGRVRVKSAKKLLMETDLTVATVGERTGFSDPAYFTRFFRQQVGVSPSDFRAGRNPA